MIISTKSKVIQILLTAGAVVGAIGVLVAFYKNSVWHPDIRIIEISPEKNFAKISINGNEKILYENTALSAGGAWGVKFNESPNRIELLKNGLVYETILI